MTATASASKWTVRGTTLVLWALAAASAGFWALRFGSRSEGLQVAPVATRSAAPTDPAAIARLLGASPATAAAAPVPSLSSRFALAGVAAQPSGVGAALISVDGKPARPFRVGATVDEGLLLKSVDARRAVLAASLDGPPVLTLELPLPKPGGGAPAVPMMQPAPGMAPAPGMVPAPGIAPAPGLAPATTDAPRTPLARPGFRRAPA